MFNEIENRLGRKNHDPEVPDTRQTNIKTRPNISERLRLENRVRKNTKCYRSAAATCPAGPYMRSPDTTRVCPRSSESDDVLPRQSRNSHVREKRGRLARGVRIIRTRRQLRSVVRVYIFWRYLILDHPPPITKITRDIS